MRVALLLAASLFVGAPAWADDGAKEAAPKPKLPTGAIIAITDGDLAGVGAGEVVLHLAGAMGMSNSPRVNLDLRDASLREALKHVLDQVKGSFAFDKGVQGGKITIRAKNIALSTALDLITQASGVGWKREVRGGKTVYRVGKSLRRSPSVFVGGAMGAPGAEFVLDVSSAVAGISPEVTLSISDAPGVNTAIVDSSQYGLLRYTTVMTEALHTFQCPHCRTKVRVKREKHEPKCEKCSRVFRKDWKFCPFDGGKRPPDPGQWRFCPVCGKKVKVREPKKAPAAGGYGMGSSSGGATPKRRSRR